MTIPSRLPSDFVPACAADFVGPARKKAEHMQKHVAVSLATGRPLKGFFSGPPGTGKSSLVRWIGRQFGDPFLKAVNGTDVSIDFVRQYDRDAHSGASLFSKWRVLWIDEFDQVPSQAQCRFLTLMDDLPKFNVVLCTCNASIDALEQRIHSRFNAFAIDGPTPDEVAAFIVSKWGIAPAHAAGIAKAAFKCASGEMFAQMDFRQALRDADGLVLEMQMAA